MAQRLTVRTTFSGALDVDLAFSPLFNALPVRRLGLHRAAAEHDLAMVFVSLPGLEVGCARQTYRSEMARAASCKASDGVSSRLACRHPSKQRRATVMASVLPLLQARGHGAVRVVALGYTLPLVIISTMQK